VEEIVNGDSRSVEEIVNEDSTCVVKGSVEEDENYVPVPIQFGYCRFRALERLTTTAVVFQKNVPYGLGSYVTRGRKSALWLRLTPEAKSHTFWPHPNMPRF